MSVRDEHKADADGRVYGIRDVAAMFRMEPSTLRYYEEVGLLTGVGRDAAGRRVYRQCHIHRLRTICCFKRAGMSIEDLRRFFSFEDDEPGHIDDIMTLLQGRREALEDQRRALDEAYGHVLRKLHYYGDIRERLRDGGPMPVWADYRNATFDD
ncbi:MerR family transcriptional regulator [Bifidobacterium leontopitheci]|uniref:Transcriptional regulator, MerR family n=1 Tax=Bifidobacterium leontopitheci TaxID=2650774 RepID=A0A6I1GEF3_9BIFI|nr:MerR family transcriptional regulator [Bifidobacterium leontopitheci]KAB7790010.1 transcriptional regulator, MerR family [Bifidobacterium leontopitheci]